MNSKIYFGHVRHRRFTPKNHQFNYQLFMLYIDLDELPNLFQNFWFWSKDKSNLASFRTTDYFNKDGCIRTALKDEIKKQYQVTINGPIRMLTHLRYFGHCFNPVTFYYCFDQSGDNIDFIVSEINNTPWDERHRYVMDNRNAQLVKDNSIFIESQFNKSFHVSPFLPMDLLYQWRFSIPDEKLSVVMQNFNEQEKVFDASLSLKAKPINSTNMAKALIKFPLMTIKVISGIYWQALKLWLKKTPFYSHQQADHLSN